MDPQLPFAFLWLLLSDADFASRYAQAVDPPDYPQGPLRALTAIAKEQSRQYRQPVTVDALVLILSNGFDLRPYNTSDEEVADLYDRLAGYEPDTGARPHLQMQCVEWLRERKVGVAIDESAKALDRGDTATAIDSLLTVRSVNGHRDDSYRLSGDIRDALGPLPDNATATGFGPFDRAWGGGARPGEFGVALASTNKGKSMVLCSLSVEAWKQGRRALYYTFELHPREIVRRIVSGILRQPIAKIAPADVPALLQQVKVRRGINGESEIDVRGPIESVNELRLDIEDLERRGEKPDIILLDSADDLHAQGRHTRLYDQLREIYTELREHIALDKQVVLWTSTQANRDSIDKAKISLKHVGDAFPKVQKAHFVLGFSQTDGQAGDPFGPLMTVSVLKDSQHGSPGMWFEARAQFGRGSDGYPGFAEVQDKFSENH